MGRKLCSLMIVLMLSFVTWTPSSQAQQPASKEDQRASKLRKSIAELKEKHQADEITLNLQDGTNLKGYLGEVADDHFVVYQTHGYHPVRVEYAQVKNYKTPLGMKFKAAFGVAAAIGAILAVCAITRRCEE